MSILDELARLKLRQERAAALRALRKIDKPLARYVSWRFKQTDIAALAQADMIIFGTSMVRIEPKDWPQ